MGAVTASDLEGWQLFSYLPAGDTARLARIASLHRFGKGQMIFSEGDDADALWVLLKGQVKIFKVGPDGREQIMRIVRGGESFGEAAALSQGDYPAHSEAMARSVAVRFPAEDFLDLLRGTPQLAVNMIAALSQLLRGFASLVDALALREVSARLAKYLLDACVRAKGETVVLDVRKSILAARLGTVSETLSRTLRRLRDRRIVRVEGQRIDILDRTALQQIAAGMRI